MRWRQGRWSSADVVAIIVVPLVLFLGIAVPVYVGIRADQAALVVTCRTAHASRTQLLALKAISSELGLPGNFEIPEVPTECLDVGDA